MANQQPEETVIAPPKVPQVYQIGNSLHLDWNDLDLSMRFFKFHDQANGLTSEVWVKKSSNNALYDSSRYTLTSVESKRKLAKLLQERFELLEVDWLGLTIQAFTMVVNAYRVGEPTLELKATKILKPLEYLIYPLLPKNVPTTLVADGGAGKSTLAILLCTLLLSAYNDEHNTLGLKMPDEPINCLYLDWETDKDEIEHNLTRFKNGLGIDQDITLHYRRCWQPMGDDMDEIQQQVLKHKPNLIVIDNMASATQTDLIGADGATKLFTRDIRQLHCTTLLLAHHSKAKADEPSPLGCYSEDTEVMTKLGWKKHADITLEDEIACYDASHPYQHWLRWQKPIKVHSYEYKGDMIHIQKQSTDILVTPNHNMLTFAKNNRGELIKVTAEHMPWKCYIPHDAKLAHKGLAGQSRKWFKLGTPAKQLPMNSWLKFLGYWISEGDITKTNQIHLYQTENQVLENMKQTLGELGFDYMDNTVKRIKLSWSPEHSLSIRNNSGEKTAHNKYYKTCRQKSRKTKGVHHLLGNWLLNNCGKGYYDKHLPSFIWDLKNNQLKHLLQGLIEGDGTHISTEWYQYYTASKQLADDVQRLAIILGYSTTFYSRTRDGHLGYAVGINKRCNRNLQILRKQHVTREPYDGQVYCLTVPSGAYVTRHNGKTAMQGNSIMFKNYSRAVWFLKREKDSEINRMRIGLYCQKFNRSYLHKPLGFEFNYFEDEIRVHKMNISDSSDLAANLPMQDRIKNMLSRKPQTSLELANQFKLSEPTIKKILSDHSDMFMMLGDNKWGVKSNMPSEVYR